MCTHHTVWNATSLYSINQKHQAQILPNDNIGYTMFSVCSVISFKVKLMSDVHETLWPRSVYNGWIALQFQQYRQTGARNQNKFYRK